MKSMSTRNVVVIVLAIILAASICAVVIAQVSQNDSDVIMLRMAHGKAEDSIVSRSVALLEDILHNEPSIGLEAQIYPSGVLGGERDYIELVKAGILDMAKVSSNALGSFNDYYSVFALPYLFVDTEHSYRAMDESEAVREIFMSNYDDGFLAIGWYASGSRNVYTKEEGPATPEMMRGKKFRVQNSATSMRMIELMGGSPVPMGAGETYTSLQSNIIDGAENTELALTVDRHGELVKSYSYTEHLYSPDIFIISVETWERMSKEQQDFLVRTLSSLNENYQGMYDDMIAEAVAEAEEMGVVFYYDIDKEPFIESVQPMHQEFKDKGEDFARIYENIQSYR